MNNQQPMSPEPCDHHWIHYGQPSHSPIRWIVKCSQCNQFKIADLQEQVDVIEAAAEQRGAYRAACQAFRHAATAFDYPEAGDQHCTWEDVAKWLRANADKHDPEHRADRLEGDDV